MHLRQRHALAGVFQNRTEDGRRCKSPPILIDRTLVIQTRRTEAHLFCSLSPCFCRIARQQSRFAKLKLTQQCIAFLCLLALFHLFFLTVVSKSLDTTESQLKEARYRVVRASKAMELLRGIQSWFVSFTLASTMSRKTVLQQELKKISAELPKDFEALCQATKDHPEDYRSAVTARDNYQFIEQEMDDVAAVMSAKPDLATVAMLRDRIIFTGFGHLADATAALNKLTARGTASQELPQLEKEKQMKSRLILFGSVALILLGCCTIVIAFAKRVTRRLVLIMDAFGRFEKGEQIEAREPGVDEIDQVDTSFRAMAERVREATEKEKAIVVNLPIGLIVLAEDGTVETLNPSAIQLLGSDEMPVRIGDVIRPLDDAVASAEQPGTIPPTGTYLLKGKSADIPVEITVSSYSLKNNRKYLFAVVDVSVKREMELMKQEFVSIVSHDLRTPLTSIKACLGLLKEKGEVSPSSVRSIELIERESDRLLRLTTDLLDLAKAESGKMLLNRVVTSSAAITEQSISAVTSLASKMGVTVTESSDAVLIDVDPDKICQILVNFLSNAVKYSPAGSTVTVVVTKSSNEVRFSVIDQGRGITQDALPYVFDRFRQVAVTDGKTGAGLGLAICRLLAECHGGSVGAESVPGSGSTFWLSLPISCCKE